MTSAGASKERLIWPRLKPVLVFLKRTFYFWILLFMVGATFAVYYPKEFPNLSMLCNWDCAWYESIARQGYRTPIPPLEQNSEASNVAFFPAYPLLGRSLASSLGIPIQAALPLVSLLCTFGLSFGLSSILRRETSVSRRIRYYVLLAYPAAFYLFVSYSEALYLLAMISTIAILLRPKTAEEEPPPSAMSWQTITLLLLLGFAAGTTRLTGFVVPAFLALAAGIYAWPRIFSSLRADYRILPLLGALIGTGSFFLYCAVKFGHWNLYFWQLKIGWYKEFSPIRAAYIFFHPPVGFALRTNAFREDPRTLSWLLADLVIVLSVYASVRAIPSAIRAFRERNWNCFARSFLVWAAFAHLFIVLSGDVGPWDYWGNAMRYSMPTAFLLALAWRDEWTPEVLRHKYVKPFALFIGAVVLLYTFSLEIHLLARFIRQDWVS